MEFEKFSFGSLTINGKTYQLVIDGGEVRKRTKKPSKQFRDDLGHAPLSIEEKIPWKYHRLVIGTGAHGSLPIMDEVKREAKRRKVELVILPTRELLEVLNKDSEQTNAILHVTC